MKRIYLRSEAREAGYSRICLEVLPEFVAAQNLYASLGFRPAPPVAFNPVPGTRFLGLDLTTPLAASEKGR